MQGAGTAQLRGEPTRPGAGSQARTGGGSPARRVAIVSDGSARWATAHGQSIARGHEVAAENALALTEHAVELGIDELTLYAFSTENWARPAHEVRELMAMLARRIRHDTSRLHAREVQVAFMGRRDRCGRQLAEAMAAAEVATSRNGAMKLCVAIDYGGRDEILRAAERYAGGGEEAFCALLQAPAMHDPDVIIRTGGERRLSNFLLWQAAYAELVFREELWPDFGRAQLEQALTEFAARRRRFGMRAAVGA